MMVFLDLPKRDSIDEAAVHIIRCGQAQSKWTHVGRVNTPSRFEHFERLGVDSIDGTGLSRYSWMRANIHDALHRPRLFSKEEIENAKTIQSD